MECEQRGHVWVSQRSTEDKRRGEREKKINNRRGVNFMSSWPGKCPAASTLLGEGKAKQGKRGREEEGRDAQEDKRDDRRREGRKEE